MKNSMKTFLIAIALILTAVCNGSAATKPETLQANIIAMWPEGPAPGNVVKYKIEVTRTGTGRLNAEVGTVGLPKGSGVTFSPEILSFTGGTQTLTSVVTIKLSKVTPIDGQWAITLEALGFTLTVNMNWKDGIGGTPVTQPTLSIVQNGPESVQVRGIGSSAASYDIQSTPDLQNPDGWVVRGSCTADANGRFTYDDTIGAATGARFYRSAQPATGVIPAASN